MRSASRRETVLIIAYDDIAMNPRPERQIRWLGERFEVEYVAQRPNPSLKARFIEHRPESGMVKKWRLVLLKMRLYDLYIWDRYARELVSTLEKKQYNLIIVHHLKLLPIAFRVAKSAPVIFDAHEYYTEMYNDSPVWNFFIKDFYRWISKNYLNRCHMTVAVDESMQHLYERNFQIPATHITNASDFVDLLPSGVDPNQIRIIHHGLASPSRKIELMIEMGCHLDDRFTLTFILLEINYTSRSYVRKLKKMASNCKNIFFLDLLPADKLIRFCNDYDIGLFFMPPSNMNEEYSLANKFFQYVQSRLMLAVSPLPEMKRLVEAYELGVVGDNYNPKAMAEKLNRLTPERVMHYKTKSHEGAKELSSESNKEKFLKIIADTLR